MRIFQPTVTGSNTTTGSLHVSGPVFFYTLETSSVLHVLTYNTASGQVFFTASDAFKGIPDDPPNSIQFNYSGNFSGSANLTFVNNVVYLTGSLNTSGSIILTGSSDVSGSTNVIGTSTITGSLNTSGSTNVIGTSTITGSLLITGSTTLTGSMFVTGAISASSGPNTVGFYGTASWAQNALTASFITASNVYGPFGSSSVNSASYASSSTSASFAGTASLAFTASFITGAGVFGPFGSNSVLSASYASSSTSASYALSSTSASYSLTASFAEAARPAPEDTWIQYNEKEAFGASYYFRYIYTSNSLQHGNDTYAIGQYSHTEGTNTHTGTLLGFSASIASGVVTLYEGYGDITTEFNVGDYLWFTDDDFPYVILIDSVVYSPPNTVITLNDLGFNYISAVIGNASINPLTWTGDQKMGASHAHAEGQDTQAMGVGTHAEGQETIALNNFSHAEGLFTIAFGPASHAEGTTTEAIGDSSHAEGRISRAVGNYSHAEGEKNIALGAGSHAEGYEVTASGNYSHAEGLNTTASGDYSHTEGWGSETIGGSLYSHAEGYFTKTIANSAHAEGFETIARGPAAHSEGYKTIAEGTYSHAEGSGSMASGIASHVEGNNNTASGDYQLVIGQYNKVLPSQSSFIIGDGTANNARHNVLFVSKSWFEASASNVYFQGLPQTSSNSVLVYDSSSGRVFFTASNAIGGGGGGTPTPPAPEDTYIQYNSASVFGAEQYFRYIYHSHSLQQGISNTIIGQYSHAEGIGTQVGLKVITASSIVNGLIEIYDGVDYSSRFGSVGIASAILGGANGSKTYKFSSKTYSAPTFSLQLYDTSVNGLGTYDYLIGLTDTTEGFEKKGSGSHAEGTGTKALGDYSHAEGRDTISIGSFSHAEGYITQTIGNYSHAEGDNTKASGDYSHAEGDTTHAIGNYSHAEGDRAIAGYKAFTANLIVNGTASFYNDINNDYTEEFESFGNNDEVLIGGVYYTFNSSSYSYPTFSIYLDDPVTITTNRHIVPLNKPNSDYADQDTFYGDSSHAEGRTAYALGQYSHAEGIGTTTVGTSSHAEGFSTITFGNSSHAEGRETKAISDYSHAEGYNTQTINIYSHAEGYQAKAFGTASHAEGYQTTASGNYSHAEGSQTKAFGTASHAEGNLTQAIGYWSHAEGSNTLASGSYSHAEGYQTTSSGQYSHAEGQGTIASGSYSHAEGYQTITSGSYSHAEGVGAKAIGFGSHAEGNTTTALGSTSHAEGYGTVTGYKGFIGIIINNIIEPDPTKQRIEIYDQGNLTSEFIGSEILIGASRVTSYTSTSYFAPTFSIYVPNLGEASGGGTYVADINNLFSPLATQSSNAEANHAEGHQTLAADGFSHAEGSQTKALTFYSHAEGYGTVTKHRYAHAEGYLTTASGLASHAAGNNTIATGSYQSVIGQYNVALPSQSAFIIGDGTADNARHNVLFVGRDSLGFNNIFEASASLTYLKGLNDTAQTNVLTYDNATGQVFYTASSAIGGGGGAPTPPAPQDTWIQYNSGSVFGATGSFRFIYTSQSFQQGSGVTTLGKFSHAQGSSSVAYGTASHAEGFKTLASGNLSHAEGNNTTSSGQYSHAEGSASVALGVASHTEGLFTIASGSFQTVVGQYNVALPSQSAFIIGDGFITSSIIDSDTLQGGTDVGEDVFVIDDNVSPPSALVGGTLTVTGASGTETFTILSVTPGFSDYQVRVTPVAAQKFVFPNPYTITVPVIERHNLLFASQSWFDVSASNVFLRGIPSSFEPHILSYHSESGQVYYMPTSSLNPAPSDTYIQYNSGSKFGAEEYFRYIYTSHSFQQGNEVTASGYWSHAQGSGSLAYGTASHAEGFRATASGDYSHAEGRGAEAIGESSHAEGNSTISFGGASHAEGFQTLASGSSAHAEGSNTIASGQGSHAEGSNTIASGQGSHAEGYGTTASGDYSHAEGGGEGKVFTTAKGIYSHAEGYGTIASGAFSHAEGYASYAYGSGSHVEGENNSAYGSGSHAEGYGTRTFGDYSHASGYYTTTSGSYQTVVGSYNIESTSQSAFIIGDGNPDNGLHNVLFVSKSHFEVSASNTFLQGLPTSPETHLLVYNTSSGQVYYTASSAIGGGSSRAFKSFVTNIVGGTLSEAITHNLGTRDLHVSVYENGAPYNTVYPDIQRTDVNTVTLLFNFIPTAGQYSVYIST